MAKLNRGLLRLGVKDLIKKDKKTLKKLEMTLHPLVRKEMREFIKKNLQLGL